MFNTPILFIIFNRPDTTFKVFDSIRKRRPKKLFIAADGPRDNKIGEVDLCKKARSIIDKIDWECEVKTLFRENNVGCQRGPKEAIDWFFEHIEMGIILEDDCLPNESFYTFCELMLIKYKNEDEIMEVSGTNFLLGKFKNRDEYYKSVLPGIWGWATWKRAWKKMDLNVGINQNFLLERFKSKEYTDYLIQMIKDAKKNKIDAWDIFWLVTMVNNSGFSIIPLKNLVTNIGISGTHTGEQTTLHLMPSFYIDTKRMELLPPLPPSYNLDKICIENILESLKKGNEKQKAFDAFIIRLKVSFYYRKGLLLKILNK